MTIDNLNLSEQEVRSERARRAVKAFRAMLPGLNAYARAIAGRRDLTVVMSKDNLNLTDGKKIFLRPHMALGDYPKHERHLCDRRDPETRQQLCSACRVGEIVLIDLLHELGHNVYGTFKDASASDKALALRRAVELNESPYGKRLQQAIEELPTHTPLLKLSGMVSPFLPLLVNLLEDVRVDSAMMNARKGTKAMFNAKMHRYFVEGVERPDGSLALWKDMPLNSQAIVGLYAVAVGYDFTDWFAPEIDKILRDPVLSELCSRVSTLRSSAGTYEIAFPILARLRELGYLLPPEEQPQPQPEPSEEDSDDDDTESQESDDSEGDSEDESSDEAPGGEDSDDESGEADSGEPGGSSGEGDDESSDDRPEDEGAGDGDSGETDGSSDSADGGSERGSGEGDGEHDADGSDSEPGNEDQGASASGDADGSEGLPGGDASDSGGVHGAKDSSEEDRDSDGLPDPSEGGAGADEDAGGGSEEPQEGSDDSGGDSADPQDGAGRDGDGEDETSDDGDVTEDHDPEPGDYEDGSDVSEGEGGLDEGDSDPSESASESGELTDGDDERSGDRSDQQEDGDDADGDRDGDSDDFDPSGEADEEPHDPVDSGADEGDGGIESPPPPAYGDEHEAIRDVKLFTGHVETVRDSNEDKAAIDLAIIQGQYFETDSLNVHGVKIFRYGDGRGKAWRDFSMFDKHTLEELGMISDTSVPEQVLGPALLMMRRVFSDNARAKKERHRKSGRVDARVLGKRAHFNDERLFDKTRLPGKRSYAVLIGVDISGSTHGVNIALAKRAAMAQAELCNRLGIDFAVYAHTANRQSGYRSDSPYDLDLYEIKSFDDMWDSNAREGLEKIGADSENLDGHSIEFYRKAIEKHRATDKIILYYSDGKMPAANYAEELEILQREIRTCRQKKITLLGVGIRTNSPSRHGLDTVEVHDDSDLIKVVKHLESAILHSR